MFSLKKIEKIEKCKKIEKVNEIKAHTYTKIIKIDYWNVIIRLWYKKGNYYRLYGPACVYDYCIINSSVINCSFPKDMFWYYRVGISNKNKKNNIF